MLTFYTGTNIVINDCRAVSLKSFMQESRRRGHGRSPQTIKKLMMSDKAGAARCKQKTEGRKSFPPKEIPSSRGVEALSDAENRVASTTLGHQTTRGWG